MTDHYIGEECNKCKYERVAKERTGKQADRRQHEIEAKKKKTADDAAGYGQPKAKLGGNKKLRK